MEHNKDEEEEEEEDEEEEKPTKETKKYQLGKGEIFKELGFDSEDEWRSWLQSDLFKPHWTELWEDYLKQKCGRKRGWRGPPTMLHMVQRRIAEGEADGKRKYSKPREETGKNMWVERDHYARFLYMVRHDNEVDPEGVFYKQDDEMADHDFLLWSVLKHLTQLHRPWSIKTRYSGGNAVMGNVPPKKQ